MNKHPFKRSNLRSQQYFSVYTRNLPLKDWALFHSLHKTHFS